MEILKKIKEYNETYKNISLELQSGKLTVLMKWRKIFEQTSMIEFGLQGIKLAEELKIWFSAHPAKEGELSPFSVEDSTLLHQFTYHTMVFFVVPSLFVVYRWKICTIWNVWESLYERHCNFSMSEEEFSTSFSKFLHAMLFFAPSISMYY